MTTTLIERTDPASGATPRPPIKIHGSGELSIDDVLQMSGQRVQATYSSVGQNVVALVGDVDVARPSQSMDVATPSRAEPGVMGSRALLPQASTVGEEYQLSTSRIRSLPTLLPDQSAKPYIAGDMIRIADGIQGLIRYASQMTGANVSYVRVSTRRFRGSKHPEVKFTVYTRMNANQAFAFWDAVETLVEDWSQRLSQRARRILDESTAISVEWIETRAHRTG